MRIYYNQSVDDIYPQQEETVIITERGVPFFQIIPFGSRINQSVVPMIRNQSFVKGLLPALFIKPGDLGGASFFSDVIMAINLVDIQSYSNLISSFLLIQGRMPAPGLKEVAVGVEVMGGNYTVNNYIDIEGENYRVVGVFYPRSVLFNHVIIGDMPLFQVQFNHENTVTCIFVNMEKSLSHDENIHDLLQIDESIQVVSAQDIKMLSSPVLILSNMSNLIFGILVTSISTAFICLLVVKKFQHNEKDIELLHVLGMSVSKIIIMYILEVLLLVVFGIIIGFLSGFLVFFIYYQSFLPHVSYLSYIIQLAFRNLNFNSFLIFYLLLLFYASVMVIYPFSRIMLVYHPFNGKKHGTGEIRRENL